MCVLRVLDGHWTLTVISHPAPAQVVMEPQGHLVELKAAEAQLLIVTLQKRSLQGPQTLLKKLDVLGLALW